VPERIRRLFWLLRSGRDHPPADKEREKVPATVPDEVSSLIEGFIGPPFDPDERHHPW